MNLSWLAYRNSRCVKGLQCYSFCSNLLHPSVKRKTTLSPVLIGTVLIRTATLSTYLLKNLRLIVIHLISENWLIWSLWHGSSPECCNSKGCILSSCLYSSLRQTFYSLSLHPVYHKESAMESNFHTVLIFLLPCSDKVGCIGWNADGLLSVSIQVGYHGLHTGLECTSKVRPLWKKIRAIPFCLTVC